MKPLLQPVAILILWSMIMWAWLYATRMPAMRKAGIDIANRTGGTGKNLEGIIPDKVQWKAHNYNHLMEQPTLFYAVMITLALLNDTSETTVRFAWAYVGLRILHSLVQALWNRIVVRWAIFMLASVALFLLSIRAVSGAFLAP